jgi:hypothetical protein
MKLQDFLPYLCLENSGEVFLEVRIESICAGLRTCGFGESPWNRQATFKGERLYFMNRHQVWFRDGFLYCGFNGSYKDENAFFPQPPIKGVVWNFDELDASWFADIRDLL